MPFLPDRDACDLLRPDRVHRPARRLQKICNFPVRAGGSGHEAGRKPSCACWLPGWLEHFFLNEYYATDEEYLFALADAMKHEYKAIVDAGFILQLDDPALPDTYDMIVPMPTIEEYRKFAEVRVDAVNHALRGPARRPRSLSHLLGKLAWPAHARPAAAACGRPDVEGQGGGLFAGSRQSAP